MPKKKTKKKASPSKVKASASVPEEVEEYAAPAPADFPEQRQLDDMDVQQPGMGEDATPAAPVIMGVSQTVVPQGAAIKNNLEQTQVFRFDERERIITTFTAGGVVLSFGLSVGSALIVPIWPAGSGLLATLGIISGLGAFMARESI